MGICFPPSMRDDGRKISVEFTIVPLRDEEGKMNGIAAVMGDVTAKFEEVKELRRKLADASRSCASPNEKGGSPS